MIGKRIITRVVVNLSIPVGLNYRARTAMTFASGWCVCEGWARAFVMTTARKCERQSC
jgi:hypothetical protein